MRVAAEAERFLRPPLAIITASLVAACVLVAGCARDQRSPGAAQAAEVSATPVPVATAMRGDIDETLEITGTAEADVEVDVVPEVSGKVARVYADVGDYVRKGQTLVRVDTQVAAAQRDQASAGVASAKAAREQARAARDLTDETSASAVRQAEVGVSAATERLEQARAAARLVESQVSSAIEQARTAVQSAETRLAEVRAGARAQQRRQAEAQVQQAKASLDLAEQTHARYHRLLEEGVISEQQYDQVRTQYQVAKAAHQQAVENLSLVEEGARTEQVRLAELAVEQSKQQLALAEANRTQIEVAQQDVRAAEEGLRQAREQLTSAIAGRGQVDVQQRQVASAEAAIAQAEASARAASVQLAKHTVRAPISGLIAARHVDRGEGALAGAPVMRIVDIDPIRVDAVVNEMDVDRIAVGDCGVVTFDGLSDREFVGTVREITPQASRNSRNFVARIEVANPGGAIKPGMFARVRLILAHYEDVIVVSRDMIVESGTRRLAYVVRDGKVEVREVMLGAMQDSRVHVLEGVREGEQLVTSGQGRLADGQSVTPTERADMMETDDGAS